MITDHDRLLAREVIAKAAKNFLNGLGPSDRLDFFPVLVERWPTRGAGGVAHANYATRQRVRLAINEFYERPDHSPEPVGQP